MNLVFHKDGMVSGLDAGEIDLRKLGTVVSHRRFSHIWPRHAGLRAVFRVVRAIVREGGKIEGWTRTWKCVWQVRLASDPGTVMFESSDRRECVVWERNHLV